MTTCPQFSNFEFFFKPGEGVPSERDRYVAYLKVRISAFPTHGLNQCFFDRFLSVFLPFCHVLCQKRFGNVENSTIFHTFLRLKHQIVYFENN